MNTTKIVAAALLMGAAVAATPAAADNETFDSFFRNSGFAPMEYTVGPRDALAQVPGEAGNITIVGQNPAIKNEARWFDFPNRYRY